MTKARTVAFHTLGCKLNYSETSSLSRALQQEGFAKKDFEEQADVYVINTCSVTENADKECRQIVRKVHRRSPESIIVVTGCYAQLQPREIAAIPGVDLVLGAADKFNIVHHIKEFSKYSSAKICSCDIEELADFHASHSMEDRTRTFLKVQDGCDYNCSFCTIPMARGRSRSDTIAHVIETAEEIGKSGVREVVLTGVNLGDFGKFTKPGEASGENFLQLIRQLEERSSIQRFRISSIEPNLLSAEIVDFVSTSKRFMPHFHLPLQSGSNRILGLMRRRYKKELYRERVMTIKRLIPHCAIGVDVIVGFPGETSEEFEETFEFLRSLEISYIHVFTYSERAGTKAVDLRPVVPISERRRRNSILRRLSYQKMQQFILEQSGSVRKVLFESRNVRGLIEGYTDNYIRISTAFSDNLVNQIVDWTIL